MFYRCAICLSAYLVSGEQLRLQALIRRYLRSVQVKFIPKAYNYREWEWEWQSAWALCMYACTHPRSAPVSRWWREVGPIFYIFLKDTIELWSLGSLVILCYVKKFESNLWLERGVKKGEDKKTFIRSVF